MTSYVTPKKNTAYVFYLGLIDQANRPAFKANPTLAAGDVKVSTDGGAFGNITSLPTVTPASGRAVQVSLSSTEMNGDNIVVQFVDAAGAEWDDVLVNIQTSVQQIDDLAATGAAMTLTAAYNAAKTAAQAGDAMALTASERNSVAAALLDLANGIETGYTLRQSQRIMLASLAGKLSGAATASIAIRDVGDTKNRIAATVDASGNRTAVTLDGT